MKARYTDGSLVAEGDRIRYHQTPGGLMAPPSDGHGNIIWHEGIAAKYPPYQERRDEMLLRIEKKGYGIDPDELHCKYDPGHGSGWGGEYGHMAPHIIERIPPCEVDDCPAGAKPCECGSAHCDEHSHVS